MLAPQMHAFHLNFRLADRQLAALRRALSARPTRTARLATRYFDTADGRLAMAGIGLSLRQDDDGMRWQSIAGLRGWRDPWPRHDVPCRDDDSAPDLSRHTDSGAAGRALRRALAGEPAAALREVAQLELTRQSRQLRHGRSTARIALDVGHLLSADGERPIRQVELALLDGSIADLLMLAQRWAERHGLWLDVRAPIDHTPDGAPDNAAHTPPAGATPPRLQPAMSPDAALRAMVASCLDQVLPNAAEVADRATAPTHLHQARVGLRRMRSALSSFGDWSEQVATDWPDRLGQLFTQLGQTRDRDVLQGLLPRLRAAGMPEPTLPSVSHDQDAARTALRSPGCTALWLELLAFATGSVIDTSPRRRGLTRLARARLVKLHRRLCDDARLFVALDDSERHRFRRRLKRLRYSIELTASLLPARPVARLLDQLKPAQELLGEYNDLQVAQMRFQCQLPSDARAWFALGWLAASQSQLLQQASPTLRCLAAPPKFLLRS